MSPAIVGEIVGVDGEYLLEGGQTVEGVGGRVR